MKKEIREYCNRFGWRTNLLLGRAHYKCVDKQKDENIGRIENGR